MKRSLLGKEHVRSIQRQITINLISRYLMITLNTILTASVHQNLSAKYISLKENAWILNGTVNMGLSCKINNNIWLMLIKKLIHIIAVGNIALYENELRIFHSLVQGFHVSCISQCIKTDNLVLWMFLQLVIYKIATNKTSATSYNYIHNLSISI